MMLDDRSLALFSVNEVSLNESAGPKVGEGCDLCQHCFILRAFQLMELSAESENIQEEKKKPLEIHSLTGCNATPAARAPEREYPYMLKG